MRINKNVISANTARIVMDGRVVGALTNFRASEDFGLEPQYQIGDIDPYENVPTAGRYDMSAGQIQMNKGTLRQLGISAADSSQVLRGLVFDVQIMDESGRVYRTFENVSYASGDIEVSANRVISHNVTLRGLGSRGTDI